MTLMNCRRWSEFVQRVQMTGLRADSGRCADDPGQDAISRLFTKSSTNAAKPRAPIYSSRSFDVPAIRRDFPILNQRIHGKPLAWFDNAATTKKPQSEIDAISRCYANDNSNIHHGAHTLAARATDAFEQARQFATEHLSRINGLRIIGTAREKVGVLSFVLKERRTEDVGRMLDLEGIAVRSGHHCAQPSLRRFGVETTVRPSFSIYNTLEEIDRMTDALKRIQRK